MNHEPNDHLVEPEDACPTCGQRCIDRLIWIDDGEQVRCAACSTIYTPPNRRLEGGDPDAAPTQ
ncbi:MAG: hypothetical protein KJZ69_17900 [Phycisphaerales bacterium]|nr:hypothetical protein [Phycisphaerales bacterium]